MAFHFPNLNKMQVINRDADLRTFKQDELSHGEKEILGRGSFGIAYISEYKGAVVVIKELLCKEWSQTGKKLIKEAKIMKQCSSKYVVQFLAVCYDPLALMLEYIFFDFKPFGGKLRISSLDELLQFCDNIDFKGLELWPCKIAQDVSEGLAYLHKEHIACRDLKVSNVLVSNQHYVNLPDTEARKTIIQKEPIICKLTDFGEARSQIAQSRTLLATKTENVHRGLLFIQGNHFRAEALISKRALFCGSGSI